MNDSNRADNQGSFSASVSATSCSAANVTFSASPSSLTFNYQTGGTAPGPQTVRISSTGPIETIAFTTSAPSFLTVTQDSATAPATLTVTLKTGSVPGGTTFGNIAISSAGAESALTIPVTVKVTSTPFH